jgi:hypothetical protein
MDSSGRSRAKRGSIKPRNIAAIIQQRSHILPRILVHEIHQVVTLTLWGFLDQIRGVTGRQQADDEAALPCRQACTNYAPSG